MIDPAIAQRLVDVAREVTAAMPSVAQLGESLARASAEYRRLTNPPQPHPQTVDSVGNSGDFLPSGP